MMLSRQRPTETRNFLVCWDQDFAKVAEKKNIFETLAIHWGLELGLSWATTIVVWKPDVKIISNVWYVFISESIHSYYIYEGLL